MQMTKQYSYQVPGWFNDNDDDLFAVDKFGFVPTVEVHPRVTTNTGWIRFPSIHLVAYDGDDGIAVL